MSEELRNFLELNLPKVKEEINLNLVLELLSNKFSQIFLKKYSLRIPFVIASAFMTAIKIVFKKNSMVFINRLIVFSLLLIISFVLTWLCLCPGVGMTQECGISKTWNTGLFHEVGDEEGAEKIALGKMKVQFHAGVSWNKNTNNLSTL
ncbi:hypothetical protein MKX03_008162 [Papaver bracteatum]|nr:hypothetical protein MKX03_008162 [Papaver bracteatum]